MTQNIAPEFCVFCGGSDFGDIGDGVSCTNCGTMVHVYEQKPNMLWKDIPKLESIDLMIGRLDRLLSEFLIAAKHPKDEADRQTLKHHADDLIGVGKAALKHLGFSDD